MIEDYKSVGSHDDQRREAQVAALIEAGIGKAYASRSLDDAGEIGKQLKAWMIENRERIMSGYGFDFRGEGKGSSDLVMLAARALLHFGQSLRVVPLVRLPKLLTDDEGTAELRTLRHLIIRDFETGHENPLRPYETALVEALIEDRIGDGFAVSVLRRTAKPLGWWGMTTEDLIEQNARVVAL